MNNTLNLQLLAIDEGRQQLSLIDTLRSDFRWTLDLSDIPQARDMQLLDSTRALVGYDHGFIEIDWKKGVILNQCSRWQGVTSATRCLDGSTLLTGVDLDGQGGVTVLTLDRQQRVVKVARRGGDYVRLMRITPQGTYLLCTNDHIKETTPDLVELRCFTASGFEHAWQAERTADGATWVSAGYGGFMAVFDSAGNLLRRFGSTGTVPAEVNPYFYACHALQSDGTLLVANWQGHGPDNGQKGSQLLQFSSNGQLMGTWSAPERISSLQGILVL